MVVMPAVCGLWWWGRCWGGDRDIFIFTPIAESAFKHPRLDVLIYQMVSDWVDPREGLMFDCQVHRAAPYRVTVSRIIQSGYSGWSQATSEAPEAALSPPDDRPTHSVSIGADP